MSALDVIDAARIDELRQAEGHAIDELRRKAARLWKRVERLERVERHLIRKQRRALDEWRATDEELRRQIAGTVYTPKGAVQ